jgi:cysteine desulfurase
MGDMHQQRLYLDHAATTPLCEAARQAMAPWLSAEFGNPSSMHSEGRRAKAAIDEAREVVSASLGALFAEIVFTSGGTEAANLAILGCALANENPKRNVVLFAESEHPCVLHTAPVLKRLGLKVVPIPVDREARIELDALEELMTESVLLLSLMHSNNEVGSIQPLEEAAAIAKRVGAVVHTDAVQTYLLPGLSPRLDSLDQVDLISVSAHKVHGPKGIGALAIRAGTRVQPVLVGGGQEREMRAGTEDVAGLVGFASAVREVSSWPDDGETRAARNEFVLRLVEGGAQPTIEPDKLTLPGHAHVRFSGIDAETALIRLDRAGISASSGAACSSGSLEPSHVLLACGYSESEAKEGLRFTFGRLTKRGLGREAADRVLDSVRSLHRGPRKT